VNPQPLIRLTATLDRLNRVANLRNGDVPFGQWLQRAVFLGGKRPETEILRGYLLRITNPGIAEPPGALVAAAIEAPRAPGLEAPATALLVDEAAMGFDETVGTDFLEKAIASTRSVAKILVPRFFDGQQQMIAGNEPRLMKGTGWLVAPGLFLTNHHVVNARMRRGPFREPDASEPDLREQAIRSTILFDYFTADATAAREVPGPHELLAFDASLDFALLRIQEGERRGIPINAKPVVHPRGQPLRTRVNLLQHPDGKPMRVGFRDNFVVIGSAQELAYLTDTEGGSSGSPVLDDAWTAVGLHRGARPIEGEVTLRGRRLVQENYGTPIQRIIARLGELAPELAAEISQAA